MRMCTGTSRRDREGASFPRPLENPAGEIFHASSEPEGGAHLEIDSPNFAPVWNTGWVGFGGGDVGRIRAHATELVALAPDVIVSNTTPVIRAVRQATSSIPIVMAAVNDPFDQGFVSSLAHPGGNITGSALRQGAATVVGRAQAIRDTDGSAAAPAARCKNVRRPSR